MKQLRAVDRTSTHHMTASTEGRVAVYFDFDFDFDFDFIVISRYNQKHGNGQFQKNKARWHSVDVMEDLFQLAGRAKLWDSNCSRSQRSCALSASYGCSCQENVNRCGNDRRILDGKEVSNCGRKKKTLTG